jgi:2-iminobutanoate/2-iminopropanoate deaminase
LANGGSEARDHAKKGIFPSLILSVQVKENNMHILLILLFIIGLLALIPFAAAEGAIVNTDKAPAALGPYSQAVWAGDLLFLSGQIGLDPESGKLVAGGTLSQAEQIFNNIRAILESQEMDFKNIVKVTVFGLDIKEFPEVNKLYATFFPENPPARSFVQAAGLPAGAAIEIEAVAHKNGDIILTNVSS